MRNCLYLLFYQYLAESLDEFGEKWTPNPGDGAFYGPKVHMLVVIDHLYATHVIEHITGTLRTLGTLDTRTYELYQDNYV